MDVSRERERWALRQSVGSAEKLFPKDNRKIPERQ
jgi:hypothetical protein